MPGLTKVLRFPPARLHLIGMNAKTKQQIREAALAMQEPFTVTRLKMELSSLAMGSASP
jgi:hypothetical protein